MHKEKIHWVIFERFNRAPITVTLDDVINTHGIRVNKAKTKDELKLAKRSKEKFYHKFQ